MRLQLEISHLREDKFKKSFQSTLNPFLIVVVKLKQQLTVKSTFLSNKTNYSLSWAKLEWKNICTLNKEDSFIAEILINGYLLLDDVTKTFIITNTQ